jgi:AcrR family transcriptional regulator
MAFARLPAGQPAVASGEGWEDRAVVDTRPASYRRSAGSPRGQARKEALLHSVVDDLAVNGLADFSLRRAARAAGTTHKVLLYYFDGPDDLLAQALPKLRERRVAAVQAAVGATGSLADRVRAVWPVLMDDAAGVRVIDQAMGLAMYDPGRYARLTAEAYPAYTATIMSWCPPHWTEQRKREVATLVVAALRGCIAEWRITRDMTHIAPALEALARALELEEKAG